MHQTCDMWQTCEEMENNLIRGVRTLQMWAVGNLLHKHFIACTVCEGWVDVADMQKKKVALANNPRPAGWAFLWLCISIWLFAKVAGLLITLDQRALLCQFASIRCWKGCKETFEGRPHLSSAWFDQTSRLHAHFNILPPFLGLGMLHLLLSRGC